VGERIWETGQSIFVMRVGYADALLPNPLPA